MTKLYKCKLADPPWSAEQGGGKIKRGADRHYPLLKPPEIVRAMLQSGLWSPDPEGSHLWLWCTNTTLANEDAHFVARGLGYRPLTFATWVKPTMGLGQYLRGKTEHLMLCVRGSGPSARIGKGVTAVEAPRPPAPTGNPMGRHSAKPDAFYELIERVSAGPRVEFFARDRREGWDAWGNEIETP